MNMGMNFFSKLKILFLHPSTFFENVKNENLMPAFIMFSAFSIINAFANPSLLSSLFIPTIFLASVFPGPYLFTILLFLWIHLFVKVFGGKRGLKQTLKGLMYASVPITIVGTILNLILSFLFPGTFGTLISGSPLGAFLNPDIVYLT